MIFRKTEAKYFLREDLTRFRKISPTGKSIRLRLTQPHDNKLARRMCRAGQRSSRDSHATRLIAPTQPKVHSAT
jgi:hypothetical protein